MQNFAYSTFGGAPDLIFAFSPIVYSPDGWYENDPPKRVIGLALASIIFLEMSVLVFPGWEGGVCVRLSLGAYGTAACGASGRSAAACRVAAATAAAAMVAVVAPVVIAIVIVVTILVFVLVAVVAPAEPGPRMTFVLAGEGRG